jgi:hypothetical protein
MGGHHRRGENDLEQVTQIAHEMVVRRGMSPRIGPVNYSEAEGAGGLRAARRPFDETTAQLIDDEVQRIAGGVRGRGRSWNSTGASSMRWSAPCSTMTPLVSGRSWR